MFYPNSVLISRTPGIATIWLMATLGAKQNSRKVSKQAVLQIDIPESCQAVQYPDVPMALRLQSNLLYGISRVYSQQCLFVLAEAEMAQNALKNLSKRAQAAELDPQAGKIRPELLVVPDDPAFLSSFDFLLINFDLSATFDSSGASFMVDSDASGLSIVSSQSNKSLHESFMPQLDIPSSGSIFGEPSLPLGSRGSITGYRMSVEPAEPEFLYDADFEFDTTGNIVDHEMLGMDSPRTRQFNNLETPIRGRGATDVQIPDTLLGATMEQSIVPITADDIQLLHDDIIQDSHLLDNVNLAPNFIAEEAQGEHRHSPSSSEHVEAPQIHQRRPQTRELPRDTIIQIPNSELLAWERDYVTNVGTTREAKESRRRARCAKANAVLVLYGFGESTIQSQGRRTASPLHEIAIKLVEQLTGTTLEGIPGEKTRKRRFSSAEITSSDSETRRSRLRVHKPNEASHEAMIEADGDMTGILDELEPSIELAREAVAMMEDQSTQLVLPWSGSRAGSVHSGRLSRHASILSTRIAGNTSIGRAVSLHSLDRRTSRLRSASPMFGQRSVQNTPTGLASRSQFDSQNNNFLFSIGSGPGTSPVVGVRGATMPEASSMHSLTMTQESTDFLAWITDVLETKMQQTETETENRPSVKITFDELLSIKDHRRAIAAQGFLHLLTLASRGAIEVTQLIHDEEGNDLWWGPIEMNIAQVS